MRHPCRRGFTILELLVVVAAIGLLLGILLPALGSARDDAKLIVSKTNLRQLGQAAATYAGDWSGRQYTAVNDNLARYGTDIESAVQNFGILNGPDGSHPPLLAGWSGGGSAFGWWFQSTAAYGGILMPVNFEGPGTYFGWFRLPNAQGFRSYVGQRWYDPVFWAPKDDVLAPIVEECAQDPHEYADCYHYTDPYGGLSCNAVFSSYCFSPAALFNPAVLRSPDDGGFQHPFDAMPAGLRVPALAQARYPELKTHLLEVHWLQNNHVECNPNFAPGSWYGCEPYYFNHGWESVPMTVFFDGHVAGLGVSEAMAADNRHLAQTGHGLWSRDTPWGEDGFLISDGWDMLAATSFHVLTTDGIRGRDTLGR